MRRWRGLWLLRHLRLLTSTPHRPYSPSAPEQALADLRAAAPSGPGANLRPATSASGAITAPAAGGSGGTMPAAWLEGEVVLPDGALDARQFVTYFAALASTSPAMLVHLREPQADVDAA